MRKTGSITVFLTLLLACFFSAVFAFLEAARVSGLKANAQVSTIQARDTVLASYNRELWENYHLLFWLTDGDLPALDSLESLQQAAIDGNQRNTLWSGKNYYMLRVRLEAVETNAYELATDHGGAAFRRQAAERMKESVGEETLLAVMNWLKASEQTGADKDDLETKALDALENLEQAKKEQVSGTDSGGENASVSAEEIPETALPEAAENMSENPLEWVRKIQKNGIYAFLMPEEELSQKTIDLSTCIERRELEKGNFTTDAAVKSTEKLLFRLYLDKYFLDASEEAADRALDYEIEYMIVGKSGDEANLKGTVRRLLLLREAANLAFLETNAEKRQEASAIALMLTSAVGHPELEPVVEQGILAAWAYAESLSDMKILLNGGRVMPIKTEEQWHTDIFHLSSSFSGTDASQQKSGLSYSNYLQLLLWAASDQRLAQRGMDMIEKNTDVKMDQMLSRAECGYTYEAPSVFWSFVTLGQNSFRSWSITDKTEISFLGDI